MNDHTRKYGIEIHDDTRAAQIVSRRRYDPDFDRPYTTVPRKSRFITAILWCAAAITIGATIGFVVVHERDTVELRTLQQGHGR